jgi:hypothetical protein
MEAEPENQFCRSVTFAAHRVPAQQKTTKMAP